MKKGILLVLSLMTMATLTAKDIKKSTNKIGVNYRYDDAVTFVERGIKFHVFLNGDFDFNTQPRSNRYYDYNGRRFDNGVRIERDCDGRIRRVGNVFINYGYHGNVKRIGNVFIRYEFGKLSRVGHLRIEYDRWGTPFFTGSVKGYRKYYDDDDDDDDDDCTVNIYGDIFDYDDVYFYQREFVDNYRRYKEDDHYFYYRANPNAKIGKRRKLIKRRKLFAKKSFLQSEQIGRSKRNNNYNQSF